MRVAGIATLAEANRFLPAWLAQYNRRFAVPPAHSTDLHRPLSAGMDVRAVLALKTRRVLRRDRTVRHGGQLYQIQSRVRATHVVVEERVDGTLRLLHQDRPLTYQPIHPSPRPVVAPRPAYGQTKAAAMAAVQALALRAMADRLEHNEAVPEELLNVSFIAA
jgi:hypothetical protein